AGLSGSGPDRPAGLSGSGPDRPEVLGGELVEVALGAFVGTRSGDKGGDANLGVYARGDAGWVWLDHELTVDRLRELLPETADMPIDRYRYPNLRALNFVIRGLLQEGVAASTRQDAQAKAVGEWLRARVVSVPASVIR
ncbi:MAG TPA: exopolyphosphatase, partial [Ilumatobacteraceae bacterium]|nr:exopolyphosphatase [Ilumatobacteraceae bacterium]